MRILIISPHFHPYFNPRASRWTALAVHWAGKGHEVHVLCSQGPFPHYEDTLPQVHVHRTGYNALKEALYATRKGGPKRGVAGSGNQGWISRMLLAFNQFFLKNIYWPDDAFIWYFPAKSRALQLLREQSFDALISVAPPFTAHWLGLYLKRHFPDLRWIADTGDPFAFQPEHPFNNTRLYGKKNRQAESDVVRRADAFVVTNPGAQKLYRDLFPEFSEKIAVIPPLLSLSEKPVSSPSPDADYLHLGYFGTFFKNIREARPLLLFFSWLLEHEMRLGKKPVLHLYGDIFEPFQQQIRKMPEAVQARIQMEGLIEKEEVLDKMQQMDFLLNLGNTTFFQLPSKTVDYLAAGRPILNLQQVAADTSRTCLGEPVHVLHLPLWELEERQEHVLTFIERMREWEMEEGKRKALIQPFKLSTIAAQFESLLESDQEG